MRDGEKQVATASRLDWVDAAKGVGIILVVFGHVWDGVSTAGIQSNHILFKQIEAVVYLFHMPLFFFLSGLFFSASIGKYGVFKSFTRRVESHIYPLVLWSYVMVAFLLIAGGLTNRGALTVTEALLYPFPPKDVYWFLGALFLIQTIVSLLPVTNLKWLWGAFVVSWAAWLTFGNALPLLGAQAIGNAPYFLAGMLMTRLKIDLSRPVLALVGMVVFEVVRQIRTAC